MIQSDKELVASISSDIKSYASGAELVKVVEATDTDAPVHIDCVNSYIKAGSALDKLRDILDRDAENIVCAAEKFSEVDTILASKVSEIPTASSATVAGEDYSYVD